MPKKYRPPVNDAKAQIAVMETLAKAGQPLWAANISEMADIAIKSVSDALHELSGICVKKEKSGWVLLPEPADVPDTMVRVDEEVGADKVEALLLWLKENQIEYSSVGYARLHKKAYYETTCLAKDLQVGGALGCRGQEGLRNTILKIEHLGYFKNRLYAIEDCVKVSCSGRTKMFLPADDVVSVRYYHP